MRNVANYVIAFAALTGPFVAFARQSPVAQAVQSTPVTKVLAVGHLVWPPSGNSVSSTMESEVRDTVRLYLAPAAQSK